MVSNEKNTFTIESTLSLKDYKTFITYHQRISMLVRALLILAVLLYVGLDTWPTSPLFVGIISLVLSLLGVVIMLKILHNQGRKEYESDQTVKNSILYVFNSEGVQQKKQKSNSYYKWTDINHVYERKEQFNLYVSKNKAIILPKRYFKSIEEIDLFKTILNENLNKEQFKIK